MIKVKYKNKMFGSVLMVYVDCPRHELEKELKKKTGTRVPLPQEGCDGQYLEFRHDGKQFNFLWIKTFDWSIQDIALLVHEASHYVIHELNTVGIKITLDSEEAFAYFLQDVVQDILIGVRTLYPGYKEEKGKKST